ncbi:MAG: hypothetical protein ACR2MB_02980 [Acidimicrobiales bacterium]
MTTDDEALAALDDLDPTRADPPPAPGSPRHHQIQERAMTDPSTDFDADPRPNESGRSDGVEAATHGGTVAPLATTTEPRRSHRARWLALAGAAAVILVIVGVVVLAEPDRPVTPVAALTAAATRTGQVTTLRASATYDSGSEPPTTLTGEIDGNDYFTRFTNTDPQTGKKTTNSTTVIGNRRWDTNTVGKTTMTTEPPSQRNAQYPSSSEAVAKAALKGATVTDLGKAQVRGTETTHYRITLGPSGIKALGNLSPGQLARFELEYPQDVTDLDVWVADDLIRRIHVRQKFEGNAPGSTIEFYDFGADITIRPPK